jgi:hypothetical protein
MVEGGEGIASHRWRKKGEREASRTIVLKCQDYVRMVRAIASLEPLSTDKRTNIDVRMPSPKFEGTDESKAQARAAALREARAKADALAAEAGVRITSVLRIEELDGNEHRGFRTDHGVMYSQVASGSFEHEELSAAIRDVEYAFRLRFGIEPSQR